MTEVERAAWAVSRSYSVMAEGGRLLISGDDATWEPAANYLCTDVGDLVEWWPKEPGPGRSYRAIGIVARPNWLELMMPHSVADVFVQWDCFCFGEMRRVERRWTPRTQVYYRY